MIINIIHKLLSFKFLLIFCKPVVINTLTQLLLWIWITIFMIVFDFCMILYSAVARRPNPAKMSIKLQYIPSNRNYPLFSMVYVVSLYLLGKKYKTQFAQNIITFGRHKPLNVFHYYSSYINKSQFLIIALKNMDKKLSEVMQLSVI